MAIEYKQFRPSPTGNPHVDAALRQAFDYIYQLKATPPVVVPTPTPTPTPANVTIISGGGGGGGTANILTQYAAVLGGPLNITPIASATDNTLLYVFIDQDTTGYAVTFGSGFQWTPRIPTTPSTSNITLWGGRGSNGVWYYIGGTLGRNK